MVIDNLDIDRARRAFGPSAGCSRCLAELKSLIKTITQAVVFATL